MTLLIIDTFGAAPFTVRAFAYCTWPEVLPMYIAAAIAVPIGTLALLMIDPIVLRWFIAILVLSLVAFWYRAGAITAGRACRSPPPSGCSPALAPARCRSPALRC